MRIVWAIPLAALLGIAEAQVPSREAAIGDALKEFGNVSGGMFLNEQCKFLDETASASFRDDVETIQPALASDIGNPAILTRIKESSKRVAESDRFKSCGEDAKRIVDQTSGHARRWAAYIRSVQRK